MYVFLDTNDKDLLEEVRASLESEGASVSVESGIKELGLSPRGKVAENRVSLFYGEDMFDHLPLEQRRLTHLAFASRGAVLFTNKNRDLPRADQPTYEANSPMFAGPLPYGSAGRVHVHLEFASNRAKNFADMGVDYVGPVISDPKCVLVMHEDASKNMSEVTEVLAHAPKGWWFDVGFISLPSSERLDELFDDDLYWSVPVAMTPEAVDRFDGLTVDWRDGSKRPAGFRAGPFLRGLTREGRKD